VKKRLTQNRVYAICDREVCLDKNIDTLEYCKNLIRAGVKIIQLRDKVSNEAKYWDFFYQVLGWRITQQADTVIIANEHAKSWSRVIDTILKVNLHKNDQNYHNHLAVEEKHQYNFGFHAGQGDLKSIDLPNFMQKKKKWGFYFGVSVHNYAEWQNIENLRQDLDYIGYGRMFTSSTKPTALESENISTDWLAHVDFSIYFIGGITLENFNQVDSLCREIARKEFGFAITSDLLRNGASVDDIKKYLAKVK